MIITANSVAKGAAALLNDRAMQIYPFDVQIEYMNMALRDLKKLLQLNNSPVTDIKSVAILIPIGTTEISFNTANPTLPPDLVEIQGVHYSSNGLDDTWSIYSGWNWESNKLLLNDSNTAYYLRFQYIRDLFTDVQHEDDVIEVINSDSYLQYRTAALLAEFVGENPTRALALNFQAENAWGLMQGLDNKGKQQMYTRRLPFRNAWKMRGWF